MHLELVYHKTVKNEKTNQRNDILFEPYFEIILKYILSDEFSRTRNSNRILNRNAQKYSFHAIINSQEL